PQAVAGGNLTRREQDSLRRKNNRLVASELRERLSRPAVAKLRADRLERIWNYVWIRRIVYFLTLAVTLLLVTMPLWVGRAPEPPLLADGRTWIGGIIRLIALLAPSFAGDWIAVYADNPFYFLSFAAAILALYLIGNWLERLLRDRARSAWQKAVGTEPETNAAAATGVRKTLGRASAWLGTRLRIERNSFDYQRLIQLFKWRLLPDVVFGPLLVAAVGWVVLSLYTQMTLPGLENGRDLCTPARGPLGELTIVRRDFKTSDLCSVSLGRVEKGHRYVVTFDVVDQWYDGSLPASPQGVEARAFPLGLGYLGVPLRRVIDAAYLQPIVEIRPSRVGGLFGNVRIEMLEVSAEGDSPNLYRGEFVARKSGELFVFANDAMLPRRPARLLPAFDYDYFYKRSGRGNPAERGNRGTACLTVEAAEVAGEPMGPPPAGSVCAEAVTRSAEAAKSASATGGGGGAAFGKKPALNRHAAAKN
ncbi:MAG: hypothetical protein QOH86_2053, partial [Sphingomonadales bacterium]|nr:hypothetical protein [Sphingomonadales bacterium]